MIIDGNRIAGEIRVELKNYVETLKVRKPCLAFILVGDNTASKIYVKRKVEACAFIGIVSQRHELSEETTENELLDLIHRLNKLPAVDGILVQLPLPRQIDPKKIMGAIAPEKDVDGFNPVNMGKVLIGDPSGFVPCTPQGIMVLLEKSGVSLASKHAIVIGRSTIVGKPVAALLTAKHATVTLAHSQTKNLPELCRMADIIIAAIGSPAFIKADMVKEGAVVIDVGISKVDGKIVGDVDFESVKEKCSLITPVPGGVGPMTIAMLMQNTIKAYQCT